MDQLDLHGFGLDLNRRCHFCLDLHGFGFEEAVPLLFAQSQFSTRCSTVMTLSLMEQTPLSSHSLDTLPSALMVVNLHREEMASCNNAWCGKFFFSNGISRNSVDVVADALSHE